MKKYFLLFLLICSFQIFISCNKDDALTDPGSSGNTNNVPYISGQPIPDLSTTPNFNGIMCAINYDFSTAGQTYFSVTMGFAQLGTGVDAGTVKINNSELGKNAQSGNTFYMAPSALNPLGWLTNVPFDGSNHNWTVTGGNGIPALSGNVASPASFTVSSPAIDASASRTGSLQVIWSNPSSARVMVFLLSSDGSKYYISQDLVDNGSHTIPAGTMSSFPVGNGVLYIVKYKYAAINGSDGKTYIMIAEILKSINVLFN